MDTKDLVFSAVVSTLLITSGWAFRKMQLFTDTRQIEHADRDQVPNIGTALAQRDRDGDAPIEQNNAHAMCSHIFTLAALPADVRDRTDFIMDANGDKYLMPKNSRFAINQVRLLGLVFIGALPLSSREKLTEACDEELQDPHPTLKRAFRAR